jgi:hypothetical protein
MRIVLLLWLASAVDSDNGDSEEKEGYYNKFSICANSVVQVQDISILCSSPGAYYYGSNKYRDQNDCQSGDKARVQIKLYISQDIEEDAYLDLKVEGPSGAYTEVYSGASLCSSISATDNATCPGLGYYQISQQIYLGEKDYSGESFTANATLGVYTSSSTGLYDLGGLNTDRCSGGGSSVISWTSGVQQATTSVQTFLLTFGILLGAAFGVVAVGYYLAKQANKIDMADGSSPLQDEDPDEDFQKVSMMGHNRNLVDF